MTTIQALMDGAEKELPLLGELHAIKGAPSEDLTIRKRVTIPGAGSYWKDFSAPLYTRQVLEEAAKASGEGWDLSAGGCLGMLTAGGKKPAGYVRRQMGPHNLCVPVCSAAEISCFFWKIVGYLPAGNGYVAVARRRVGYWVWLSVAALLTFAAAYLLFRFGPDTVAATLRDLPDTLSSAWFKMLRDWGVL